MDHWIWGAHSIESFLENYPELVLEFQVENEAEIPSKIVKMAKDAGVKLQKVKGLPKQLSDKRTQGLAAKIRYFPTVFYNKYRPTLEEEVSTQQDLYLVLDGVEDPRNYGAILRSAAAFGVKAVFVAEKHQAPLTGVVAQASAGQCFRVPVVVSSSLKKVCDDFKTWDAEILVLEGESKQDLGMVLKAIGKEKKSICWVVGAEGRGVRPGMLEVATRQVRIPLSSGVESLNASVAASIALYATRESLL